MDEIAQRAGVAKRDALPAFLTRLDLIEALLAEQTGELAGLGRGPLAAAEDDFDALSTWLRATVKHAPNLQGACRLR